jgi:hypothetical protein
MLHEPFDPCLLEDLQPAVGEAPCLIGVEHNMPCSMVAVQKQAFTDV